MSLTLTSTYTLKKSGSYTNPLRASDVLPVLFGDLTENSGNNPITPCVLINTATYTHAISGEAVLSEANGNTFRFWDENGDEISNGFSVQTAVDYEDQGTIALVTFDSDHGEVSCQCQGRPNDDGNLITNPVDMFETILGGAAAVDRLSFTKASVLADDLGYVAAGAITSEHQYQTWLTNLAASFLMDHYVGRDDTLKLRLDSGSAALMHPVFELIERDTTRVEFFSYADNLVNQIPAYYAPTYAKRDRRFREGTNINYLAYDDGESTHDVNSIRRYGLRATIDDRESYTFDWCRNTASVNLIQARLVEKFATRTWLIDWEETSKISMQAEEGDFGVYSCRNRIDETGTAVSDRYVQLLKKGFPLAEGGLKLYLRETQKTYRPEVKLWDGTDMTLGDSGAYW